MSRTKRARLIVPSILAVAAIASGCTGANPRDGGTAVDAFDAPMASADTTVDAADAGLHDAPPDVAPGPGEDVPEVPCMNESFFLDGRCVHAVFFPDGAEIIDAICDGTPDPDPMCH